MTLSLLYNSYKDQNNCNVVGYSDQTLTLLILPKFTLNQRAELGTS